MTGLGTFINTAAIAAGGLAGLVFGKFMTSRSQDTLNSACGLCVIFIGIAGTLEKMMSVTESGLISGHTMMVIGSFTLGSLLGELLNIEYHLESFGNWLKAKTGSSGDLMFVEGFVNASLTVCIGAMAVVGAIRDGIQGDFSILAAKAVLDFIIILVMTASMGKGCLFSAIPVAVFQGSITLLARVIAPLMTASALDNLSLTGSMLIFCVGVNLIWGKKIKVANMLPTLMVSVVWTAFAAT